MAAREPEKMMERLPPRSDLATHEVVNQPAVAADRDLWNTDIPLREAVDRTGGQRDILAAYGAELGKAENRDRGRVANRRLPELVRFDQGGRRLDEVRFTSAYHDLMEIGIGHGYSAMAWEKTPGGHATHAAMVYLTSQVEPGVCCPMTMTYAAVPVLQADTGLRDTWLPKALSRRYDPSIRPVGAKTGVTLGMAMTEKQGGSDVRSNSTVARPDGDHYRLTGHKWFCSAPMSDGFLTLAQADGGLTCFLVPRWLEGERNRVDLIRLKDKLGNRSNASAEIEYGDALAHRVGEEGDGVRTILEMVHQTRLDTAMAPAGLMRAALAEAHHWCSHRTAFQKRLIDQPLMRAVLADLALDWEGSLALGLRVAQSFDGDTAEERAFARIGVALAKFLSNKLCPNVTYEAMEVLGGMGYVEDTPMPMLYREAPLNSIWEGSGNVICLDVLRTLGRSSQAAEALARELDAATGADPRYDSALAAHRDRWSGLPDQSEARWFTERLATLLTGSILIRAGHAAVADGYVATRVAGERGRVTGSVAGLDIAALLDRIG